MKNEISILSFSPDRSGFYRVAAELPPGNAKHAVIINGQDLGSKFSAIDDIIICSNSFVEVYPQVILVDDNGKLSHEKITVSFNTDEFTPMGIYATLGILKGDNMFYLLNYDEHKVNIFERSLQGTKNKFVFEFPQGNRKLSDLFGEHPDTGNSLISSMSQPLVVILEVEQVKNYKVSNHKQLSSSNLANSFSSPVKFVKSSDFTLSVRNIIGDEDSPGLITFELNISKTSGYGLPLFSNSLTIQKAQDGQVTSIQFSGYKPDFPEFINSNAFEKSYSSNTEVNLLQGGVLYLPELGKTFVIERSTTTNANSTIIIDENIISDITNKGGSYYNMIVSDYLPTHYRIRSDRGDSSSKYKLKISSYDFSSINYETIFVTDSILDDSNVYIELIDDISGVSVVKKIDIDRSQVLTSTSSSLSDEYVVSSIFFTDFDAAREIFWNPILTAMDGDLGVSSKDKIVYLRLGSNREIDKLTGFITIGSNLVAIKQESTDAAAIPSSGSSIVAGGHVLNINGNPISGVVITFQIALNENISLPSLSTLSTNDGSWEQTGFINGQTYIVAAINNGQYGEGSVFFPASQSFSLSGQSNTKIDFILSNDFTNSAGAGNSSNNNETNSNTFILKNNNKTAYVKLDFNEILSLNPEQNLQISSDIKVFDMKGNIFSIRL